MNELSWHNAEGLPIHAVHWPVQRPRAVFTLVHGQGEHIGRYDYMARWYNAKGVAVLGYDHQGYGRSGGRRGHARNLGVLLDDIGQALEATRQHYPGAPHILYGHSLGGHLALNYLFRRRPDLQGVVATAPWIRLAFPAPVLKVLTGRVLQRFLPAVRLPNGLAVHFLSKDPAVVEAYKSDPLVHNQLSLAAGIDLLDGSIWLDQYRGETPAPLLLQHGTADKITSAQATLDLALRLKGNVTFREWPGLYHEIHQEPEKEQVFRFTLEWVEKTCLKK
ncbi:MAG: alpha/beta hydrolase [Saprospirales bacterium]|jgi:alpha-beta hydrolase superfamily lysophospholipase|nr:alpha/beta hydrolase [Saprospirales bacterium]MBK8921105.1 alpha/beta hydrolase [Saprospirales bacterium]